MSDTTTGLRRRDTAIKLPIAELCAGTELDDPSGGRSFQTTLGRLRRVRILGIVLSKYSSEKEGKKPYTSLTLDDGSGTIRVKQWGNDANRLAQFERGMVLDVIGRVRSSDEETYITSELEIQILEPTWELVRRLEIVKQYRDLGIKPAIPIFTEGPGPMAEFEPRFPTEYDTGGPQVYSEPVEAPQESPRAETEAAPTAEASSSELETMKDQLILAIKKLDAEKGASYDELKTKINPKSETVFEEALMDLLKDGIAYEPSPARYKILQ